MLMKDQSKGREMLSSNLTRRLIEDVLCAAILLGVCALLIVAPPRLVEDPYSTTLVRKNRLEPGPITSDLKSRKAIAKQGTSHELTD